MLLSCLDFRGLEVMLSLLKLTGGRLSNPCKAVVKLFVLIHYEISLNIESFCFSLSTSKCLDVRGLMVSLSESESHINWAFITSPLRCDFLNYPFERSLFKGIIPTLKSLRYF